MNCQQKGHKLHRTAQP